MVDHIEDDFNRPGGGPDGWSCDSETFVKWMPASFIGGGCAKDHYDGQPIGFSTEGFERNEFRIFFEAPLLHLSPEHIRVDPFRGYRVFPKWDEAARRLRDARHELRWGIESAWDALRGKPDRNACDHCSEW
jgi:hypothetical protein